MPYSSIDPSNGGAPGALSPDAPSTVRNWTCPFCPLLCDDIALAVHANGTLDATDVSCPRLAHALGSFGPNDTHCAASVDALPASFDDALAQAAHILAAARRPLFGGLATDVAGTRALYTLAASCGATLDHVHGESMSAATRVMQDRGACFTTLSEVRSRADLLIFFGCRPSERYPLFYTRALGVDGIARELVFIGAEVDPAAKALPKVLTETMLPQRDVLDTVALWSALAEGRPPASLNTLRADGQAAVDVLASLVTRIAAARYTVLVYEPAALPNDQAALVIEGLQRIVKAANRVTRAGTLALAGDDGALTVNQAVTWLSGLPLPLKVPNVARMARVSEAGGTSNAAPPLEHDARRFATARLIAGDDIDALLWVASFGPTPWPEAVPVDVPVIVIGHPALAAAAVARGPHTVFIPAATPAIDAPGHLFRLDGTVVARLTPARSAGLQSVAGIVARLTEQLAAPLADQPAACPGTAQP